MQCFPRSARLLRKPDFEHVFASPLRCNGTYFRGQIAGNTCGCARLGLAVSKRLVATAVDRNRLRRVARETFRRMRTELGARDYVIGVKAGAARIDNRRLRTDLESLLRLLASLAARSLH